MGIPPTFDDIAPNVPLTRIFSGSKPSPLATYFAKSAVPDTIPPAIAPKPDAVNIPLTASANPSIISPVRSNPSEERFTI